MKRWFLFDNEPITGSQYLVRLIVSPLGFILFIIPGFWLILATVYKRANAFNHGKTFSVIASILITFNVIINIALSDRSFQEAFLNDIGPVESVLLFSISALHLYLLFFNGNKISYLQKIENEFKNGKISLEEYNGLIDKYNRKSKV